MERDAVECQLVQTETSDRLRLDGAWQFAGDGSPAALLLHGVGGNFYGSSLLASLAGVLRDRGWSVLRANTRGHDLVSLAEVNGRYRWEGAAFETVARCVRDVAAWLAFLREHRPARTAVIGHSLGALKAVYAAAHDPSATPDAIVALSPPRLSYAAFANGPERDAFLKTIDQARDAMRRGRATELLTVRTPFPLLISAGAYLDKYGPDENYNLERFAGQVRCPVLYVYGQHELESGGTPFAGIIEAIQRLPHTGPPPQFITVDGADHFYTDRHDEVTRAVIQWLTPEG